MAIAARIAFVFILLTADSIAAAAQWTWSQDVRGGVDFGRAHDRPVVFYLRDRKRSGWDEVEEFQNRTFRDPAVSRLAGRFVRVELSNTKHPEVFTQWGLPESAKYQVAFASSDGKLLLRSFVGGPAEFIETLRRGYAAWAQELVAREIEPILLEPTDAEGDEPTPSDDDRIRALDRLQTIGEESVDWVAAEFVHRTDLSPRVRLRAYRLLAQRSSRATVPALLEHAADHAEAAALLSECNPSGAALMLGELGSPDSELLLPVYQAVTKICRVPKPRPEKFWAEAPERSQREELARVRELVRRAAEREGRP